MPKGNWKATGQFLKDAGMLLKMYPNTHRHSVGEKTELPSGYQQKCIIFSSFSLKRCISVYIGKKSKTTLKNINNSQRLLF
jgi:hypothetical protein